MQAAGQNIVKILEYRNGLYQGEVKGNKRHGKGILITDDNLIIVSEWKNDAMSGRGLVFLSPEEYGFGDFNRGELEGGFLFRGRGKTLFAEFNMSRPINKLLYINYETERVQTLIHKTPIFEIINEKPLTKSSNESSQLLNCLNIKLACHSLVEFLNKQLCQASGNSFKSKSLNNGNTLFHFDDETNPTSLGFCLNKNDQLVSCGMYVGDKLAGLGCKYENGVRYQGMFEGGFVNGVGLKFSQGKYSFGVYENGNLVQAKYIDDRSSISEQMLQEFKKMYHLRSIWYQNSYIRSKLIKFRGLSELVFEINSQQEYLYPQITTTAVKKQNSIIQGTLNNTQLGQFNRSNSKNLNNLNNSGSKNLALNMLMKREGDRLETKSSREFIGRGSNLAGSAVRNDGPYPNMNTKTTIDRAEGGEYFKNPEDDDDLMDDRQSSSGLRNLRKFKY